MHTIECTVRRGRRAGESGRVQRQSAETEGRLYRYIADVSRIYYFRHDLS